MDTRWTQLQKQLEDIVGSDVTIFSETDGGPGMPSGRPLLQYLGRTN